MDPTDPSKVALGTIWGCDKSSPPRGDRGGEKVGSALDLRASWDDADVPEDRNVKLQLHAACNKYAEIYVWVFSGLPCFTFI